MTTTVLETEMLELLQIRLNQTQQKSLLFQCKINNIQYLGRTAAIMQQLKFMKNVDSNIIAISFLNYGELPVLKGLF